ncbi:transposase InsO family protein [Sphingomonas abaci]|uniref:Transposase InsO family protein n=1 Tax=Sphingomonas abaci TaxID=237611 RepID=A0A7W7AM81_9SPHN|nr:transposase InsO family protein [Sphingomonas abaci]
MTVWIEEGTTNASEEAQARGEIFYSLAEARMLIEAWRRHYNTIRPHSSLGYRPPAPEAATPPT